MSQEQKNSSKSEIALTRLVTDLRCFWDDLVTLAENMGDRIHDARAVDRVAAFIAKETDTSNESGRRKLLAVGYFLSQGHKAEEIREWGQRLTLSKFSAMRKANQAEQFVQLRFSVPGSLRDRLFEQIGRICAMADIKSMAVFWEFILAEWSQWSDEQIQHSSGECKPIHAQDKTNSSR